MTILNCDAIAGLKALGTGTVQTCITSPPYFGLRDYGVDKQIGLESSPDEYVARLVEVFREVKRVLKADGTFWLNLGDSYSGGGGFSPTAPSNLAGSLQSEKLGSKPGGIKPVGGLKPKDLIGIPWRVAFALQADGWWLRSDIIWSKPNPMPEAVRDRCTKAHEYVFLLSKSAKYYYNADAIKEASVAAGESRGGAKKCSARANDQATRARHELDKFGVTPAFRNKRSVWTITPKPYRQAHFAVMPEALVEPCILAGSRPGDTVLDPFAGACTVGVVAERLGRQFIGTELNPEYVRLGKERLAANTNRLLQAA